MRTMLLLIILIFCLAVPSFQAHEGQKPEEKPCPPRRRPATGFARRMLSGTISQWGCRSEG